MVDFDWLLALPSPKHPVARSTKQNEEIARSAKQKGGIVRMGGWMGLPIEMIRSHADQPPVLPSFPPASALPITTRYCTGIATTTTTTTYSCDNNGTADCKR